jgi:hypothetical protein
VTPRDYFRTIQRAIAQASYLISIDIRFDEVGSNECYIHGVLQLESGFELHFAEYVTLSPHTDRLKYRYHLQPTNGDFVVRWDNAAHHRHVATFPHHRHNADGTVSASPPVDLPYVLKAIVPFLLP